jgi:7-cyano-7-deazaguanine synthase in queuosine biosynthesis
LCIPVHDPARWSEVDVLVSLHDAIGFLTGDSWNITFVERIAPAPVPRQKILDFPFKAKAILAYSNGMDSQAVAGIIGAKLGDSLVRVRVGSGDSTQPKLYDKPQAFTRVPYRLTFTSVAKKESSARNRGFKFAIVSAIAAYLTDADEIVIPESGQGVIGPALITVGYAYPDFRNHPLFIKRMERFVVALFRRPVQYVFPRIWHTKGETLRDSVALTGATDWKRTKSCWRDNRWSSIFKQRRQCGVCAACMLRRLSVHAAGLVKIQTSTSVLT